ncbi:hypothetical protein BJY04DRAFT_56397 [Aspergillus karnatakaensis]|uniref:uncharacterized protein n=1 Tax=Aspergillus karnatakaensis TaxID=1810916 RepID=UPI003CCD5D83
MSCDVLRLQKRGSSVTTLLRSLAPKPRFDTTHRSCWNQASWGNLGPSPAVLAVVGFSKTQSDSTRLMETVERQGDATIAKTAGACLQAINRCLEQSQALNQRQQSLLEDQRGRFSIWASNTGAFAPRRASLDHRLRMAPDVQRLVRGLLQALNDHLDGYLSRIDPSSEVPSLLKDDLILISKDIGLLHRLSNSIRSASKESQNLKAATNFLVRDEEGNDVGIVFRDLFAKELIQRKFPYCSETLGERLASAMLLRRKRILYRRFKHARLVEKHEPPVAPRSQPEQGIINQLDHVHKESTRSEVESRATTAATTILPEQFRKVSSSSFAPKAATLRLSTEEATFFPPAPKASLLLTLRALKEEREDSHRSYLRSLQHYDIYYEHHGHPPIESSQLERLEEDIFNAELELRQAIENDKRQLNEEVEIVCPYCCCSLVGSDVLDDNKWRNHIKHDMDAYICLFEDCESADTLYSHSDDWLKHLRGHRLRWRCTAKAHGVMSFKNKGEYLDHIRSRHKTSESQIQFLSESSGLSSGPIFDQCPLCGDTDLNVAVEDHIAGHLRYLALKSLPYVEDHQDHAEDTSDASSVRDEGSRGTIKEDSERGPPPGFDDTRLYGDDWESHSASSSLSLSRDHPLWSQRRWSLSERDRSARYRPPVPDSSMAHDDDQSVQPMEWLDEEHSAQFLRRESPEVVELGTIEGMEHTDDGRDSPPEGEDDRDSSNLQRLAAEESQKNERLVQTNTTGPSDGHSNRSLPEPESLTFTEFLENTTQELHLISQRKTIGKSRLR